MALEAKYYAFLSDVVYFHKEKNEKIISQDGREFRVLDFYKESSGYYGAIYKDIATGELIVAHRGTEFKVDMLRDLIEADGQMALGKINQQIFGAEYLVRRAQELAAGAGGVQVTVTGHSLGGALAQITAAKYSLYGETFNAYGAAGLYGTPEGGTQVINHIRATDLVAAAGTHFGEVRAYATLEDVNLLFKNPYLPTAPTLLDLIQLLPPVTHDIADFYDDGSDNVNIITDANRLRYEDDKFLYELYRNQIWAAAHSIPIALPGLTSLNPLTAAGYVAMLGYLFSSYSDAASRAAFLGTNEVDNMTGTDTADYMSGLAGADLFSGGDGDDVLMGGSGNDTLRGQSGADYLDGGTDNDYLDGGSGNDRLEGGTGHDRYDFSISDFENKPGSTDTIDDSDGQGQIEISGVPFAIGQRLSATSWKSADGAFTVTADLALGAQTLTIKHVTTGSTILVNNWANGMLGITLGGDIPPVVGISLSGGDDLFGEADTNTGNDAFKALGGNDGLDGGAGNDVLDGGTNDDLILGGSGDDRLYGGDGNDVILDGSDLVNMRELSTVIGTDGKSEQQRFDEEIAQRSASVISRGKSWFIYREDGGAATGNATLDGNYIIYQPGRTLLDPNVAPSGDDVIDAGAGSDSIAAGEGNDIVLGGTGDDSIDGGHDDDILYGGDGNDVIDGDLGENFIAGVHFTAMVSDMAVKNGHDVIDGGEGDDILCGGGGNDVLYGGNGNDEMSGRSRAATVDADDTDTDDLDGGAGNDTMFGDDGDDTLVGADGNDTIRGDNGFSTTRNGNDTIDGGNGDDTISGDGGDDVILGGNGADMLCGDYTDIDGAKHGNDLLDGGAGNDLLWGNGGNDALDGGEGNDALSGGEGKDALNGGNGEDDLYGDAGDDTLSGGAGNDRLFGHDGNDSLSGGAGVDALVGGAGDDVLDGGEGNDEAYGDAGADRINAGSGDDKLWGGEGDDVLAGAAGNDQMVGDGGNDALSGGDGADVLFGDQGDDRLAGDAGNDQLIGGAGNDHLDGGGGNDRLNGGTGSNRYVFGPGSGWDVISANDTGQATSSVVEFAGAMTPTNITFSVWGYDLIIDYGNGPTARLKIESFGKGLEKSAVGYFEFADGTHWSYGDMRARLQAPTAGNDGIGGFSDADLIHGGSGDDRISGNAGDDVLYGDDGNDTLIGGGGSDVLDGGAGDDRLFGHDPWANERQEVIDDASEDVLRGGAGNDTLYGGRGSDLYIYDRGDGADTISEDQDGAGISNHDTLRLGHGILPEHVSLYRNNFDLIVVIDGSSQQIAIKDYFRADDSRIERIEFDGGAGAVWLAEDIASRTVSGLKNTMVGTSGNDVFVVDHTEDGIVEELNGGTDMAEASVGYTLPVNVENLRLTGILNISGFGNGGNNILYGNSGNNALYGGGGDDAAYGGGGNDEYHDVGLIFEEVDGGIDTIYSGWRTLIIADNVENAVINNTSWSYYEPNVYVGNALSNDIRVSSAAGSVVIDGGVGADHMVYTNWNSVTFRIDNAGDTFESTGGARSVTVESVLAGSYTFSGPVTHYIASTTSVVSVVGSNSGGKITALNVASGSTLAGGGGDDYYVIGANAAVIEHAGQGVDTVEFTMADGTFSLGDNIEKAVLAKNALLAGVDGNAGDNVLLGNEYANVMSGLDGADGITGGLGNDRLFGGSGDDLLMGDDYSGYGGNDLLDGGSGNDIMKGQAGSDVYYVDSAGDVVEESQGEGYDKVFSKVDYTLAANVEDIELLDGAVFGGGNSSSNVIVGNEASNLIEGAGGDDELRGAGGADIYQYEVGDGNDRVMEASNLPGENDILRLGTGIESSSVSVRHANNAYEVRIGDSTISINQDGSTGASAVESIQFADGTVWNVNDVATQNPPPQTTAWFNEIAIKGRSFSLVIPAGTFVDTPDDVLTYTANVPDWLTFDPQSGSFTGQVPADAQERLSVEIVATDSWGQSARSYLNISVYLPKEGTAGADNMVGTSGADALYGYAGNDSLNGAAGADIMFGGAGNDTYTVDAYNDRIVEIYAEGDDLVKSSIDYDIGNQYYVERLTLTGTQAVLAVGNDFDNVLTGNSIANQLLGFGGNDTLDGGISADYMEGGLGDDIYIVDNMGDEVVEVEQEGVDQVKSSQACTLGDNVENLLLTGSTAINGTGNALDNVLTGNGAANTLNGGAGNDTLDGGAGNDTMVGGLGDDSYVVGATGDVVTESANAGVDTVNAAIAYTLGSTLENLTLTGTAALNGTGNAANNVIAGNSGNNVLSALAGNDTLEGKGGTDTLTGGTGNDTYLMARAYGSDTVDENDATAGNTDVARFLAGVAYDQLWFKRPAGSNHLEISIIGTTDKLVIKNWYLGAQYRVEEIRTVDGNKVLYAADVQALVNAMGGMTPPAQGQTTLSASQRTALAPVFASSWHDQPAAMQVSSGSLPATLAADGDVPGSTRTARVPSMAGGSRPDEDAAGDDRVALLPGDAGNAGMAPALAGGLRPDERIVAEGSSPLLPGHRAAPSMAGGSRPDAQVVRHRGARLVPAEAWGTEEVAPAWLAQGPGSASSLLAWDAMPLTRVFLPDAFDERKETPAMGARHGPDAAGIPSFDGGGCDLYDMVVANGFGGTAVACGLYDSAPATPVSDCHRLIEMMAITDRSGREALVTFHQQGRHLDHALA